MIEKLIEKSAFWLLCGNRCNCLGFPQTYLWKSMYFTSILTEDPLFGPQKSSKIVTFSIEIGIRRSTSKKPHYWVFPKSGFFYTCFPCRFFRLGGTLLKTLKLPRELSETHNFENKRDFRPFRATGKLARQTSPRTNVLLRGPEVPDIAI